MTAPAPNPRPASLRARLAELEQRVGQIEGREIVGGAAALAEVLDRVTALERETGLIRTKPGGTWVRVEQSELELLRTIRDLARDAFGPDPARRVYSVVEIRRLVDA